MHQSCSPPKCSMRHRQGSIPSMPARQRLGLAARRLAGPGTAGGGARAPAAWCSLVSPPRIQNKANIASLVGMQAARGGGRGMRPWRAHEQLRPLRLHPEREAVAGREICLNAGVGVSGHRSSNAGGDVERSARSDRSGGAGSRGSDSGNGSWESSGRMGRRIYLLGLPAGIALLLAHRDKVDCAQINTAGWA